MSVICSIPRVKLFGILLVVLAAVAVSATSASAASARQSVCVGAHGKLHLRNGACRRDERRLPLVRGRSANSSPTITTCVNRHGELRVISRGNCRRGERKLIWNVEGPAGPRGKEGAKGKEGSAGPAGQPQEFKTFGAGEEATGTVLPLFTAGGDSYTFDCYRFFFVQTGAIDFSGAAATSYSQGVYTRPSGQETKPNDLKSAALATTEGSTEGLLADSFPAEENAAKSTDQVGVWTITVQGGSYTTWIHAWIDVNVTDCKVAGTAVTLPNTAPEG